jgi:replication factor C subunit 3/5
VEILTYISKRENFDLSASFAATIATQSRQNMREAILALEACKTNKYSFSILLVMKCFPLDLYVLWF